MTFPAMRSFRGPSLLFTLLLPTVVLAASPADDGERYFAHKAVRDEHGVIAPWYAGLNGQCDFRVRIAAETLKRYPWSTPKVGLPAPDYVFNGRWAIDADGTITPQTLRDWGNGDLGQRIAYCLLALVNYYQYTADPAAIAHIEMLAERLARWSETPDDHPWPNFLVSVPTKGEPYGQPDPQGMIQLDIVALAGLGLVQAYELTGNEEWLAHAGHWADVLADKRNRTPGKPPWNRYANPEDIFWNDLQTGGVVILLDFFDELIRVGYDKGRPAIREARQAGVAYLRDVLLPRWLENDTWARHYWDWDHVVQGETVSELASRYMIRHPGEFPHWRTDARNIAAMFLQRACASTESNGGVFSGAWAYPEGAKCCDRSLSYPPQQVGPAFAEYGVSADDEWGRELARRQMILATYDSHETGVVEDDIDGGQVVAGGWFSCTHPLALDYVLDAMGWLPETLGANRENHIMRCSAIVNHVSYERGRVCWTTYDAPAPTVTVLRLAFTPETVTADGKPLPRTDKADRNGYRIKSLANGDCVVTVRHDGAQSLSVTGQDPQSWTDNTKLAFEGNWSARSSAKAVDGSVHVASQAGARLDYPFTGHQVRVIGSVDPAGGQADVYLDGVKQLCGIDTWNPSARHRQVLYYRSGLTPGPHTLSVVVSGQGNLRSTGTEIAIDGVQSSDAAGSAGFGSGGGPAGRQTWIFGYPERQDYVDSQGQTWRPAAEVVIRTPDAGDTVPASWYTTPRRQAVAGTDNPALYAHGMHGQDFTAYFTVGPGRYHVRLKFMEHRNCDPLERAMNISINGRSVVENMDIAATATGREAEVLWRSPNGTRIYDGLNRAVDLVFNDIAPAQGTIAVRLTGIAEHEAIVSAIEIGPGPGPTGAQPVAAVPVRDNRPPQKP